MEVDDPDLVLEATTNLFVNLGYDHVVMRIPSYMIFLIQELEREGFVMVDGYLDYIFNFDTQKCPEPVEEGVYIIRTATKDDIDELMDMAGLAYQSDRYHCDPFLTKEIADNVYRTWIKSSVLGKYDTRVDVADYDSIIGGFSTCRLYKNKRGVVGITAVRKEASGLGIGRDLLKTNLRYFYEEGMDSVTVGTQLSNVSAMRLYSSVGFKVFETYVTLVCGV